MQERMIALTIDSQNNQPLQSLQIFGAISFYGMVGAICITGVLELSSKQAVQYRVKSAVCTTFNKIGSFYTELLHCLLL